MKPASSFALMSLTAVFASFGAGNVDGLVDRAGTPATDGWLVVNEDNDHFFKLGDEWQTKEGLERYLDIVLKGPVTHFFMCVNGQRTSYDSKTWEPIWAGLNDIARKDTATAPDGTHDRWAVNAKKFFDAGIDPYEVWTKRCREKGASPWISMRMNDVHYLAESNYFRNTTFCRTRRDLRRVPESRKGGTDFALDFAQKEVRDYTYAQFCEIAGRWDADGIEMDWMRDPHCLRPGRERADAHCLTEFMRAARRETKRISAARGRPLKLSVRLPRSPAKALALGFDIDVWLRDGLVDLVVGSSSYLPDPDLPVADWMRFCREHNPSVPFLPCLDCCELRDAAAFRALAARYRAGGAKGLYLFNAPYVGALDSDGRKHGEDTFAVICAKGL